MTISTSIYDAVLTTIALAKSNAASGIHPTVGDNLVNEEPLHDSTRDIDGQGMMNRIIAYLSEAGVRTRPGNLIHYAFSVANAIAPQAALAMARDGGNDAARVAATGWRGGQIVGLAVWVEGARTAGTLTITPTINGTAVGTALDVVIDATNTQFNRFNQLPGTVTSPVSTFSALDRLGVEWATDAAWAAGATPSVSVDLVVTYGGEHEAL